ncbi:hypothetical protein BDZ88DRAFT_88210 [Geranomyces variabilis]|nr:hypothetical protein BDZ88DRAFT_88210 [Geranomyces variabilis]
MERKEVKTHRNNLRRLSERESGTKWPRRYEARRRRRRGECGGGRPVQLIATAWRSAGKAKDESTKGYTTSKGAAESRRRGKEHRDGRAALQTHTHTHTHTRTDDASERRAQRGEAESSKDTKALRRLGGVGVCWESGKEARSLCFACSVCSVCSLFAAAKQWRLVVLCFVLRKRPSCWLVNKFRRAVFSCFVPLFCLSLPVTRRTNSPDAEAKQTWTETQVISSTNTHCETPNFRRQSFREKVSRGRKQERESQLSLCPFKFYPHQMYLYPTA